MVSTALVVALVSSLTFRAMGPENPYVIEAETMTLNPSNAGRVTSDPLADTDYISVWSDAAAEGSITTTESVREVMIRAKGERCEGAPQVAVTIDGQQVTLKTIDSETWTDYPASTSLAAGTHTVTVHFINDHDEGSSCDRNLALDRVSLASEATGGDAPDPLLFYDGFEHEADEFGSPWAWVGRAKADRLTTSDTVTRKGARSARFTVDDDDVYPLTPTENPRAQLNSGSLFCEGDARWIGSSFYFPLDFPDLPDSGWLIVGSYGFAPPYEGGAPGSLTVRSPYNGLTLTRDESYGRDEIWRSPLRKGEWTDFVFHVKFSRDPDIGFVELWVNGQRQTFFNGEDRLYYATLKNDSTDCGELIRTSYRKKGMFEWVTVYQDEVKVGTSYEAVALEPNPS